MIFLVRALATALAIGVSIPALAAGPSCRYAPDIVAFSDIALAHLPHQGRSGGIPASEFLYLKIKYGSLSNQEGLRLIGPPAPSRSANALTLEELRISLMTPQERLSFLNGGDNQDRTRAFLLSMSTALPRALMKDGNLPALLQMTANTPDLAASRANYDEVLGWAGASLPEPEKSAAAQQLDRAGYPKGAAITLASKADIGEWITYRKSHPSEDIDPGDLLTAFILDFGPSLRHDGMLGLHERLGVAPNDRMLANMLAVRQLHRLAPLGSWLLQISAREAQDAPSSELIGDIDAGKLDARSIDDLAIAFVTKLEGNWGRPVLEQNLSKYPVSLRILSLSGNEFPAELFFDTALARKALAPLLANPSAPPPTRPDRISRNFAWNSWVEVAQSLQAGKQRPDQPYVTIELLQAAGRSSEAAATLSAIVPRTSQESERVTAYATKMLVHLLRHCDDEMNTGDSSPLPLYRFGEP